MYLSWYVQQNPVLRWLLEFENGEATVFLVDPNY